MFAELPKLLDRNFALGHFLPSALFIAVSLWLAQVLGLRAGVLSWLRGLVADDLSDQVLLAALVGLVALLGGLVLLTLNRTLYRVMEGYWPLRRQLSWLERRRFGRLRQRIAALDHERDEYRDRGEPLPDEIRSARIRANLKAAEEFPDEEGLVLPTTLGNTIRAFERYPFVMYGIDGVEGWTRLLAVIPKDYRGLIDGAKAEADFWLNLCVLAGAFVVEYIGLQAGLFIRSGSPPSLPTLWFLAGGLLVGWIGNRRARIAAIEWGSLSKAAFDVYLPELRKKLSFPELPTGKERRDQMQRFSQAIIYRKPAAMPNEPETQPSPAAASGRDRGPSLRPLLGILAANLVAAAIVLGGRLKQRP
jgi:hypothetical protein